MKVSDGKCVFVGGTSVGAERQVPFQYASKAVSVSDSTSLEE